jgi:ATP-dependent DNA helicase DinG
MRTAISLAGGREVCFVCRVDAEGAVVAARPVARGDVRSVLALPGFAQRGELLVHNHPSGALDPSEADLEVAARLHDDGVGFGITDNAVSRLYVVVEIPAAPVRTPLDSEAVAALLGPGGAVARSLARYEDRPAQRDMAARVARAYSHGGVAVIEAGTGIGKSLGYLVPALRWAHANGERTVVSTNTITLQEQLVGKDLPLLASALDDQPVRFALLKGWRNYVCLSRLEQAVHAGRTLFGDAAAAELEALETWAARSSDGSLGDLTVPPSGEVWDEVAAEADLCTRLKCRHFDRCFVFAARRRAAQADVVVVNHHLLMADLAVRRASQNWSEAAVLPAYSRLVVDEGHHLEEAAATHLGSSASRRGLQRLFARLSRNERGLLPTLERRLRERDTLLSAASLDLVRQRLAPSVATARTLAERLFGLLADWMATQPDTQVRLTERFDDAPVWRAGLGAALDDLLRELALVAETLVVIAERLGSEDEGTDHVAQLLGEVRGVVRRLDSAGDALRGALRPGPDAHARVRWIEMRGGTGRQAQSGAQVSDEEAAGESAGREPNVAVSSAPLDLAPILRDDLFRRVETCLVTSATLAVGDDFDFIASRLGLDQDDVEPDTAVLPSSFDWAHQVLLAIPTDLPAPNDDPDGHLRATARIAADLIEASGGGVFLLYTSHRDVREAAQLLRAKGLESRGPLLVHGEDSRDALLRRFRDHGDAVLVGTATFWEGVDVPGRALRGLLLARVPFRVPSEPLTAAHCEAIQAAGGNAFTSYMVPHAALRLKQGFGRLIRTADDRGVVVLCDPRVLAKSYGATLLDGLPPARRLAGAWPELKVELARFYGSTGLAPPLPAA